MSTFAARYTAPLWAPSGGTVTGFLVAVPTALVVVKRAGVTVPVYSDRIKTVLCTAGTPLPLGVAEGSPGVDVNGDMTVYLEWGDGYTADVTAGGVTTVVAIGGIPADPLEPVTVAGITTGTITGITDLAVADGGTGASSAAAGLANLGGVGTTGHAANSVPVSAAGTLADVALAPSTFLMRKATGGVVAGTPTEAVAELNPVLSGTYAGTPTPGTPATAVVTTGAQTVGGVKTYSDAPIVPAAAFPQSAVASLVTDMTLAKYGLVPRAQDAFGALAGATVAAADVLFVGDSHSEGAGSPADATLTGRWVQVVIDAFRAMHQPAGVAGGRGYVPVYYDATDIATAAGFTRSGPGVALDAVKGLGRRAATLSAGGTLTLSMLCTSFDVIYTRSVGAGTFTVAIDGGAPVSVSCVAAPYAGGGFAQRFTPSSPGTHSVVIAFDAGTNVTVEGVMIYNGDESAGVRLWDGAKSGYTAASFAANATWYQSLQAVVPDLVFVELGVNDFRANIVPAAYATSISSIISAIRSQIVPGGGAIVPNVPIVLVHAMEPNDGVYTYQWSQYLAELVTLSNSLAAVGVVDLSAQLSKGKFIGGDNLHLTTTGHRFVADAVAGQLSANWRAPQPNLLRKSGGTMTGDLGMPIAFTIGAGNHADLTGKNSIGVGQNVLSVNTTGLNNTALGNTALVSNTTGNNNTAVGQNALVVNTTGGNNTAVGQGALDANSTGSTNSALGQASLGANTTGASNTAVGASSLATNTSGASNTAVGVSALSLNQIGNSNTAIGVQSLLNNSSGSEHVGIGVNAGRGITSANWNIAIGGAALYSPAGVAANATTTGSRVVAIGFQTGQNSATQRSDTVMVGHEALTGADQACAIGAGAQALHANSVALGAFIVTTAAAQVMIGARDMEITDTAKGVVIKSPDGTRYRIQVANGGALSAVAA